MDLDVWLLMSLWIRERTGKDGKKKKYWYFSIRVRTGERYPNGNIKYRRIVRSLGPVNATTKTQARQRYELEKEKYKNKKLPSKIPTLTEFTKEYLIYAKDIAGKRSWWRDEYALNHFIKFFGDISIDKIRTQDLYDYQSSRKAQDKSNGTINREISIIRRFYNVASFMGKFAGDNPAIGIKPLPEEQSIDRVLSLEEQDKLLSASPEYLYSILVCALNTGMRKWEILSLQWENVDLENNFILIESRHTKTKRYRKVPINTELKKILEGLQGKHETHVFVSSHNKPYKSQDSLKKSFSNAIKKAGIKKLRFHDLRHTVATRLLENGASITDTANILGHYNLKTTMRYVHPGDSIHKAAETLSKNNDTQNDT